MKRFRGGLVFKAHRLVYHSTLGLGVTKKKKEDTCRRGVAFRNAAFIGSRVQGSGFWVKGSGFTVQALGFRVEGLGLRV